MRVRYLLEAAAVLHAALLLSTPIAAKTVIHIRVHHHNQHPQHSDAQSPACKGGSSPMSVEGVEGVFCVSGAPCVADKNGTCPDPQPGLEFGAYCGKVQSGVLGCKPFASKTEWEGRP
ncbi:hypothetical protein PINS_up023320 [Pythium insidiosum]|nr:hypothetical protein PINS_up023320 [Pythium insidiosum]